MQYTLTRKIWVLLICILLSQVLLRAFQMEHTLFFLEEQARDYTVLYEAWENKSIVKLGPIQAGTHGVKLGPGYYYLLLPFLILFDFHPITGSVMVGFLSLGALAITFIYTYGRAGPRLAIFFTLLLIGSENIFLYTSYPSNTSILIPLQSIFLISCMEWIRTKHPLFIYTTAIIFSLLLHAHLSSIALFLFLILLLYIYREKLNKKNFLHVALAALVIPLSYTPVLLYDLNHQFRQTYALLRFFLNPQIAELGTGLAFLQSLRLGLLTSIINHNQGYFLSLSWQYIIIFGLTLAGLSIFGWFLYTSRGQWLEKIVQFPHNYPTYTILGLFTILIFVGTVLAQSAKPRHYILLFYTPLLLAALGLSKMWQKSNLHRFFCTSIIAIFYIGNIYFFLFDLRIESTFPINSAREGFSTIYVEENDLSLLLIEYIQSQKKSYALVTNDPHKNLNNVLEYLNTYNTKGKKVTTKKKQAKRILYVIYLQNPVELSPNSTPVLATPHFVVYDLPNKKNKDSL